ncbi:MULTISPECIES: hypothetical protein [Flavobacteriaceae]|uniref:hypothetical protein n=1 Tax=Flavobacteriaceae TaxID=49546 RepID=UPI001490C1A1|nr:MULTISPECIES: hypothetical protein [Allomuricauda]MDC6366452.1 hypothetical protein [Muricauda sp. AC10]
MGIDNAWGVYPSGFGGDNPGKLGQILRTRHGANTNSTSTIPPTQYRATTRPDFGGCD